MHKQHSRNSAHKFSQARVATVAALTVQMTILPVCVNTLPLVKLTHHAYVIVNYDKPYCFAWSECHDQILYQQYAVHSGSPLDDQTCAWYTYVNVYALSLPSTTKQKL